MPLGQKVVVIGGGHNGLITAFYLAKGGFKPVVLERREMVGGGAVTEEFHPGFFGSALAHTMGPLRADVARDLQVEKFDCQIFHPDPRVFSPSPDGRALLFYSDVAKTAGAIARVSAKDGENYTKFAAGLEEVAAAVPVEEARTLIGLAGSVTTVAAIAMRLPAYDAARIHHARVAAADVHAVTRGLLAQTRAERAAIGVMHPGRVDVIGGGALILDRLMRRFGFAEVLVSEHDILDGMAWSLAGDPHG